MYKSLVIENFRHFREFRIQGLKRINLLTGLNSVGKTALLEAVFVLSGAPNADMFRRININRGMELLEVDTTEQAETPWDVLFPGYDSSGRMVLQGETTNGEPRKLIAEVLRDPQSLKDVPPPQLSIDGTKIDLASSGQSVLKLSFLSGEGLHEYHARLIAGRIIILPPPPPVNFLTNIITDERAITMADLARLYGNLEKRGEEGSVVEALRIVEPRLKRLTVVAGPKQSALYGKLNSDRLIPLALMGGGAVRFARLLLALANCRGGVLLVDEVENGFHYTVLPSVWAAISGLAKKLDVQVFATTHSYECLSAAHESFIESADYDFCLFRLDWAEARIEPVIIDKQVLETATESDLEVRA